MSRYRYEIDNENAVRIWDLLNPNEKDAPFLFQPTWPEGTAWASREEAEQWTLEVIAGLSDTPEELDTPSE